MQLLLVLLVASCVLFCNAQNPICGNGIVEKGEQCDFGTTGNLAKVNCCTPQCQLFQVGQPCGRRLGACFTRRKCRSGQSSTGLVCTASTQKPAGALCGPGGVNRCDAFGNCVNPFATPTASPSIAPSTSVSPGSPPPGINTVTILSQSTTVLGVIRMFQLASGAITSVTGSISGLTPGLHGFHIHQFGDLTCGCECAGPHWNPAGVNHGAPNATVHHLGDLGNIQADNNGVANFTKTSTQISLFGTVDMSALGRSFVVHADQDDLGLGGFNDSLINGHSGVRLACGIIGYSST